MNCVAYRDHFSAYAEGSLPGTKRELLRAHLEECRDCGPQFARFVRGLDALAVERAAPAPAGMGDQMLETLGLPPRRRSARWRARWTQLPRYTRIAAAVLAVATLGIAAVAGGPPAARGIAAGLLGVERGPGGAWVPADAETREALAVALGRTHVERVADASPVRDRVLTGAGLLRDGTAWRTPAEQLAERHRARGLVRFGDQWVTPAELQDIMRRRSGLVQQDGRWYTPDGLAARASRDAGLVYFEGGWRPRAEVEELMLRSRGFVRDGDRWATARETQLLEALDAERKRRVELSNALDDARRDAEIRAAKTAAEEAPTATVQKAGPGELRIPANADPAMVKLLGNVRLLTPVQVGDAIVIPLARRADAAGPAAPSRDALPMLVSATAAMAAGKVKIDNRKKVRLTNTGPHPVLLVAGEIITGGKQDRLIKRDVIVESGKSVPVDVFCAEKDRNTARGNDFDFKALNASGSPELRRMIVSGATQDNIWTCIANHHRQARMSSPTKALQVTYTHPTAMARRANARATFQDAVHGETQVVGMAIVRNGVLETVDVYADPGFFRGITESLLSGVVLHASTAQLVPDNARQAAVAQVKSALEATLASPKGAARWAEPHVEFAPRGLRGYASTLKGQAVHLCVVTPLAAPVAAPGPRSRGSAPSTPSRPVLPTPDREPSPGEVDRKARPTPAEKRIAERRKKAREDGKKLKQRR